MLEEVRALHQRPDLHEGLPAIRAVGYRQLWQHLEGRCSLEEALEKAVAATRQLARRQLTWLRKWPELAWIYTDSEGNVSKKDENGASQAGAGKRPLQRAMTILQEPGGPPR